MCLCVCLCPYPFNLVGHCNLQQGGEVGQPGTEAVTQDRQLGQKDVERPSLCRHRQQLAIICPAQLVQTWRRRVTMFFVLLTYVPSLLFSSHYWEIIHCLTFGLIIQPNHTTNILELRQLVDLYAATKNTRRMLFHFHKFLLNKIK